MMTVGPIALFARTVLSWNVSSHEDINEESLSLFTTLEPKIGLDFIS
jgi:NADH dehydrogenase [ubiquinone] 1 alpha subcomplex assembly factor 3